jgi:hypothetical protein
MLRLTADLLARLKNLPREAWAKMNPRTRAALLVALGATGGVVVDRNLPRGGDAREEFWEHAVYVNAPGDLVVRESTFGLALPKTQTTIASQWGVSGSFAGKAHSSTTWGAWGGAGLAHAVMNLNGGVQSGVQFGSCAWLAAEHPDGAPSSMRWGIRGFDVAGATLDGCAFSGAMGAGIQVALRAWETGSPELFWKGGVHRFANLYFDRIGNPKSERWGAFTISEHAPEGFGQDVAPIEVQVIDVTMVGGHLEWNDGKGNVVRSPRGLLVQGRKRLVVRGLRMDYPAPYDGWAAQVWDVDDGDPATIDVIFEDCFIREGRIELRNCGSALVRNVTGGAYLVVGTNPKNDPSPFPIEKVTYQGPVSAGYAVP